MSDETFNIGFDANEDDARRAADEVFDAFERRMRSAFEAMGREFTNAFRAFRQEFSGGTGFRRFAEDTERAARAARDASAANEALDADIRALEDRFRSFRRTAQQSGADPGLLAVLEREFQRLLSLQRDFERDRERLAEAGGEQRRAILLDQLELIKRALITERTTIQSELRDRNALIVNNLNRQREAEESAARERIAAVNAARSRFVVTAQQEGAQRLAEQRIAGQRLIQQERATQRRRIELLRFTLNQVRTLERTLGSIFSTVGAVASGATRRVASALSNLGDVFRRNNRNMVDGLQPALNRRETLISRSFRSQEISVSRSIQRQQATLQRFEQQAQRGLAGAATGQSLAGRGLAGLGLGFAGGLGGAALLRGGFERFSNIERLQKQFEALTGSAEKASALLAQVSQFAKETPFDLVGVADLAKGFLAIGTAAEDVIPRVKTIADAVALTGGNADSLVRIQRAIGQVVSAGRLQGDELNQLAENLPGLNIRKILADQLTGGDTAALAELQEAGKLTADMFLEGLLTGLSTDPRLEGASADLAKTLSGRVANLRESFEDFGASLIGLIANPLRAAVQVTGIALQGLSDFIKGEGLSAALDTLRTAAAGAAIALGGLLVARAAGEALQFLALGLRAVATPFGIFTIAVAGLGAALAVLMDRSPEVRGAIRSLGESVSEVLAPALSFAAELVATFTRFLTDRALPALEDFAVTVISRIEPALTTLGRFFTETLMPGLTSFADFVLGTAVPAIAGALTTAFNTARDAAISFWNFVEPIIGPAIDGFGALGSAIADVISGNFSALLPGLRDAAVGIGRTFSNIGQLIFTGLRGPVEDAIGFLRNAFSADNLRRLGLGFLELVEEIGFIIGNIATDRRVVTALAAIAAAAAAIAVQLIRGLARGIADNLPDLADALRDLGVFIIRQLATFITENTGTFLTIIGAALIAGRALVAFSRIGTAWGKAAGDGFVKQVGASMSAAARTTQFSGQFFQGLFGGSNFEQATREARQNLIRSFQQTNRDLIALTGSPAAASRGPGGRFAPIDQQALDLANEQLRTTVSTIGEARAAGVLFRDSFGRGLDALRERNLPAFGQAVRDMGRQIGPAARAAGTQIGNLLVAGIGAALAGQAAGAGSGVTRGIGIAGVLSSALFAGLSAGSLGAPVGIAVGATTLAIGGLTAALSANEAASKKAASEMREYRDALVSANTASERLASSTDVVLRNLQDESPAVIRLLEDIGFNARLFADQIIDGTFDAGAAFQDLIGVFGASGREAFDAFQRSGGGSISDFLDLVEGRTNRGDRVGGPIERLRHSIRGAGLDLGDLRDAFGFLTGEGNELRSQLTVADDLRNIQGASEGASFGLDRVAGSMRGVINSAAGLQAGRGVIDFVRQMQSGIAGTLSTLEALNQTRVDQLETNIDRISTRLGGAQTQAELAAERLNNFFTAGTGSAVDQAVTAAEAIATAVQTATEGVGGEVIDSARRNLALDDFRRQIQNVVSEGFASGAIDGVDTTADLFSALSPLSQALDELLAAGEISQDTRRILGEQISDAVNSQDLQAQIGATIDAQKTVDDLQGQLDAMEVELNARLNITNLDDIELLLGGTDKGDRGIPRSDFGPTVPPAIINIEGARSPVRVARETVRQLALQGARNAARADEGRI